MREFLMLSDFDKKELEKEYRKYPFIDRLIAIKQAELEMKEDNDTNIGGGRSSFISKPTEAIAIKRQSDQYIIYHQHLKQSIDEIIDSMDNVTREIATKRFWDRTNYRTWEDLAKEYHYAISIMYAKRDKLVSDLACRLGKI